MRRTVRRRVVLAVILVLSVAAIGAFAFGVVGGSSRDPVQLLTTRPSLPTSWIDAANGNARTPIAWREMEGPRTTDPSGCDRGRGAIRGWSDGGDAMANPDAYELVCVYRTQFVAWAFYRWQSLHGVAGEDWPNYEPGSNAPIAPRNASALDDVHADEWEIGCGLGNPDALCGVWTFRARYDEVLVVMELRTIDVGTTFEAMRRFVTSVDRDLNVKMAAR